MFLTSDLLLAFSLTLLVAVLVSERAERSVLSTAVLFLAVGFTFGPAGLGWVKLQADSFLTLLAELTLVAVLFTDAMQVNLPELRRGWHLPAAALLLGLPLTLLATALAARFIMGFSWYESLLIGAVLSPTDPVLAAAIVGRREVPLRVREMLNLESGLNDGLALPLVIIFLALIAKEPVNPVRIGSELVIGILVGIAVPVIAVRVAKLDFFEAAEAYLPLGAFAIGLIVLALSQQLHGNAYLAAFSAGVTVAAVSQRAKKAYEPFGRLVTELLKLATLLVLGAFLTPRMFAAIGWQGYGFVFTALVIVRPGVFQLILWKTDLTQREKLTAGWFGPKGFASVLFGLLVLKSGAPRAGAVFEVIAVTIAISIVAHSSTDVLMARGFRLPVAGKQTDSQAAVE